MVNKESQNQVSVSTQLVFPSYLADSKKEYYKKMHYKLPKMKKNQLNIRGINMNIDNPRAIKVTAFIRSTIEKPINMKPTTIILLDKNLTPFAEKEELFTDLGSLSPGTSKPLIIEFLKDDFKQSNIDLLKNWTLAFKENTKHRVDFSDFSEPEIDQSTKDWLNELAKKETLETNELSFMGFSAKRDKSNNLLANLLIRNGTTDDLKIKQLPLEFYDASGIMAAKGTFKIENMTVQANTSKPINLVFPVSSILKNDMDLSTWSIARGK